MGRQALTLALSAVLRENSVMTDPRPGGKRLALFFDGTWNTPESKTNVWELYELTAAAGADGVAQVKFYDPGVGTHWYDRLSGGAFGAGLPRNVRQGYEWLRQHYSPGDDIFLFGFSRGAFTARSLAGFIARCGLLKPDATLTTEQAFARYRKGAAVPAIYDLLYAQRHGKGGFSAEDQLLLQSTYYHRNLIKMVGVWDTVGSIGLPFGNIPGVSSLSFHFLNTHLSRIVQNSYQALALDEERKPYWAILWTRYTPTTPTAGEPDRTDDRLVEQRWFAGAHCNVGGGYQDDILPLRPQAWLQEKAIGCGLNFNSRVAVTDADLDQKPRDSYAEFLRPVWQWLAFLKTCQRYVRWVMANPMDKPEHKRNRRTIPAGRVQTVNERIDLSVLKRCQRYPDYRPTNLKEWAQRKGFNLEELIANPENHPELIGPVTALGIEGDLPPRR
jgi:uncharacterized protein (DUF2235 family)